MARQTIFISDLHLWSTTTETTKIFLRFLEEIQQDVDALYILGDLFKFWIGDDDHSIFNEQIKNALKKASIKVPIYLMPGNRDFLLGSTFAQESGCILMPDPCTIALYEKPTVLSHGDILCTKDIQYRIFRNIIRIPYGLKIFLKLPLTFRLWVAANIQKYSAKINATKSQDKLVVPKKDAINMLKKFNSDQIIHGHVHIANNEMLVMGSKKARRISLGEWTNQASILVYYDNHSFEFKS